MLKLYSWNINGIRAVTKKGLFQPFLDSEQPDILCLQETKAKPEQFDLSLGDYDAFWYSADKPGYSGTGLMTKPKPLQVINGFPKDIIKKYKVTGDTYGDPNQEGRVIAAEFDKFWVVTVYTPNAKEDLSRVPLRHKHWDPAFLAYCKGLESGTLRLSGVQGDGEEQTEPYTKYGEGAPKPSTKQSAKSAAGVASPARQQSSTALCSAKPVVFCGDLNVAHTPDDLANDKANVGKKGFTAEERSGFQAFIDAGFVDTLRLFKQGKGHYTWWSHFANARERNVGWRIDYVLVSASLKSKVKAAAIHPKIFGSDHCPVSVTLDV